MKIHTKIKKFAGVVEYDGSAFKGWQRQQNQRTVQACLEKAISQVANESVEMVCAGRTDAGVHGTGQVIHFETSADREIDSWIRGINRYLPEDVVLKTLMAVSGDFHARYSALARRYQYKIFNHRLRPGLIRKHVTWHPYPLNEKLMHEAAQVLLGEQDFSSFRDAQCQSHTAMRNIHFVNVSREGDFVVVDIKANAFLHHMVRNIVGSLLPIGDGRQPVSWLAEVLAAKDRTQAGITAPASGLCMVEVEYPLGFTPKIISSYTIK